MIPDSSVWKDFPVLAVFILSFALIAVGLYQAGKSAWVEYCKERDRERTWRDDQNRKRDEAAEKQNELWRSTVKELADRWEKQDKERDGVLNAVFEKSNRILDRLSRHDERAERIERRLEKEKA